VTEELNQEGCDNLRAAVVEKAVKDYAKALKVLKKNPNNIDANATAGECELFFREYANAWTDIDGESIIRAVRERVSREESGRRIKKNAGRQSKYIKERKT